MKSGGGWQAIGYFLKKARQSGGLWKTWKALSSKNACKTCALGMGGQKGGMVNETGRWPEVCKKSIQAMAADMQGAIPPDFWKTYSIEQLRKFTPQQMESCGRLAEPVVLEAGAQYYQPIEWSEAIGRIVEKLKALPPEETFWYFSGRSSNEAGFLLQLFARLYGTNNVNNCSYYCHQASGVGLTSAIGSGTATVVLEDLEHSDLVFVIGGNPASNHPRLMSSLKHIRRRGGQVIVINPVREIGLINFRVPSDPISLLFGTKIASQYVQPHIGGDLALLTGVAKRILELDAHDKSFVEKHCQGFALWRTSLDGLSWQEIEAKSGVDFETIDKIAQTYATSQRAVFCWTMGITHHAHGVENVQAIANLAMLRGMLGKPHAGLLPIRGHSNVQGIGSMGVTPKLKDQIFARLQAHFDVKLPESPGLDTLACMQAADAGQLRFGFCLGGNLYGSNPDATFAAQALAKLDMAVYLSTTLNTGHAWGCGRETIIVPVLPRDEEPQATTQESMFNYVRLSDGGPARITGPRSEVQVIADIASQVFDGVSPLDWNAMHSTGNIRAAIAKVVPGFEAMGAIDKSKQEFHIGGRTFHEPRFPTADGKAVFHVHELPDLRGELRGTHSQFRLMTVRSEGQFNTVVYEESDIYRGQDRRDVVLMNPADIERLDMMAEQRVLVFNEIGEMRGLVLRSFPAIKSGNILMYYPEANVLVPRVADPKSRTPAFKGVIVSVRAAESS